MVEYDAMSEEVKMKKEEQPLRELLAKISEFHFISRALGVGEGQSLICRCSVSHEYLS